MQKLVKYITVTQDDLDALNHVNNVRYVQWVQDIAEEHWLSKAPKSILDSYFWVLVQHNISYKGSAVLGDAIRLETYVEKSEGVKSIRRVSMYNNASNQLLVDSETHWCFMAKDSSRPARITPEVAKLFN
ncbi:thioesterase [Winogradskyella maritima]|uniref:Acyl-CoA thioesterase n=1 Tax=Winogradskyella maritima TaxID=1517766 RepID=A0ABV8AIA6_9FLAO|nr:thioesterase [Winogradskyella maritima]